MTKLSLVALFLNFCLVSCALWAAITARSTWKALQKRLAAHSTRSLAELDAEVASITTSLSSISTTVKRLSSRYGMQETRERKRQEEMELDSPSTHRPLTKDQIRRGLASGKLTVLRDNPLG